MTERVIPNNVEEGRKTPVFDAVTVPRALLNAHKTSVWAELVVLTGSVDFQDELPAWKTRVRAGERVVIVPQRSHHIEPGNGATFYVQFYDVPSVEHID
jgi:tellurite resistance-related uncharacterized protein